MGKIYTFKENVQESYYRILSGRSVICVLTFIVLLNMSIIDPPSCGFSNSIALSLFKSSHIKKRMQQASKTIHKLNPHSAL